MRIRLAVPPDLNEDETKAVLDAALESVTRANEGLMAHGKLPSFVKALQGERIKWRPEPPGDEHFDLGTTVRRRGWGDCDDLAPWHAASLRASGEDPEATAIVKKSGPGRWHAIVRRHNGAIQDPSKAAGMGSVGGDDYVGPLWGPMFQDRLSIAAHPLAHGWGARVDVPSLQFPMSYSALARGAIPKHAVVGAIRGGCRVCGEDEMTEGDALTLGALHDLLLGAPPDDMAEALERLTGDVGFLPALLPAAASLAAPVLSKVLPGGGGGGGAPGGGGGGGWSPSSPGSTIAIPGGPIIVRF